MPVKPQEELQDALAANTAARNPKNRAGIALTTLSKAMDSADWDYSEPTLDFGSGRRVAADKIRPDNAAKLLNDLVLGVNLSNMMIAGGVVVEALFDTVQRDTDIDVFVYGLNEAQASARVQTFIDDIVAAHQKRAEDAYYLAKIKKLGEIYTAIGLLATSIENVEASDEELLKHNKHRVEPYKYKVVVDFVRNDNMIQFKVDGKKFQVIFRLYKSKGEILVGFDLPSCAVGYDGNYVYATRLGYMALKYKINWVAPEFRSASYAFRLVKYCIGRGFRIVLPGFDMKKLMTIPLKYGKEGFCETPLMAFSYNEVGTNSIQVSEFFVNGVSHDYMDSMDRSEIDTNGYVIADRNLRYLLGTNSLNTYYAAGNFRLGDEGSPLVEPPQISEGHIKYVYDDLVGRCHRGFPVRAIKAYLPMYKPSEIAACHDHNADKKKIRADLARMIAAQRDAVIEKMYKIDGQEWTTIKWRTEYPGSQITGSFNPMDGTYADMYGFYA